MAEDYNGTPLPEDQAPEPSNDDQNDNIPDWMKEAGWETSSGTFDESKPVFDDLDDEEDEIVPADIPAWLEEAAPEGFSSDPDATPAFEGLDVDEPFITTGDLVPPPSMDAPAQEPEPEPPPQETEAEPASPAKEPTTGEEFDIPSWLDNLELDEDSQETAVAWLENMPESLRATEDELQAAQELPTEEPDVIEEPVDELAWIDEMDFGAEQPTPRAKDDQAELSEDLIASELLPETSDPDQIFEPEEIESIESDLPPWLQELGDDQPETPAAEEPTAAPPLPAEEDSAPASEAEDLPDWLQSADEVEEEVAPPAAAPSDPVAQVSEDAAEIPEWLNEFEDGSPDARDAGEDDLDWLDSLPAEEPAPSLADSTPPADLTTQDETELPEFEEPQTIAPEPDPLAREMAEPESVSPEDETLNTQIPDWLSNISDAGDLEDPETPTMEQVMPADESDISMEGEEFDETASWLDQLGEPAADGPPKLDESELSKETDWLDEGESTQRESSLEELIASQQTSSPEPSAETPAPVADMEQAAPEQESLGEDSTDDLPDWLSELREEEDDPGFTLEDAIRQSDRDLNQAEVDFLSQVEEKQEEEAEWLSKLDADDSQPEPEAPAPPLDLESLSDEEPAKEPAPDPVVSGGMLERLKESEQAASEGDVPQWLSDLKEEEDPQETAVLWLQQFVKQGDEIDIKDEIKRYTDELDPGDSIPKWMEDLKNEEDPQTTAMLWLERLASQQAQQPSPEAPPAEEEDQGWLAELEREATGDLPGEPKDEIQDFDDPDQGWLADLEIDEQIQTTDEDEGPDWSAEEEGSPESEPSWMKATSPLEGDFFTDELQGGEEQEVEVPDWLAGYAEGEGPDSSPEQDQENDEYTWLSATDTPVSPRTPLDLNTAAISQLESILGISHQVAKGIVTYREEFGPYQDFADLKNVPEITDEQTIEILRPEVFIETAVEPEAGQPAPAPPPEPDPEPAPPVPKPEKKPAKPESFEEMLVTARARLNERSLAEATDLYAKLIKKKKFLDEIIEDLQQASLDHPLEISVHKSLGDAFMKKNKLDEALEAYSKAEDLLT